MKSIALLLIVISMSLGLSAQTFTDPIKYNDFIVGLQTEIGDKIMIFNEKMGEETMTYDGLMPYYNSLLETTKSSVEKMGKLHAYESNTEFRNSALELMKFYERTVSVAYMEMIDIIYKSEMDEAAISRIGEIIDRVSNDESAIDKRFISAQDVFAQKYGFTLSKSKFDEETDE